MVVHTKWGKSSDIDVLSDILNKIFSVWTLRIFLLFWRILWNIVVFPLEPDGILTHTKFIHIFICDSFIMVGRVGNLRKSWSWELYPWWYLRKILIFNLKNVRNYHKYCETSHDGSGGAEYPPRTRRRGCSRTIP